MKRIQYPSSPRIGVFFAALVLTIGLGISNSHADGSAALVAGSQEDFEGGGLGFTLTGAFDIGSATTDYWAVIANNGTKVNGSAITSPPASGAGVFDSASPVGGMVLAGDDTNAGGTDPVIVTFNTVNVAGLTNLSVNVLLAAQNPTQGLATAGFDAGGLDNLEIQVSYDGAPFQQLAIYQPDSSHNGGTNSYLSQNGGPVSGNAATAIEQGFKDFSHALSTATTVQIRILVSADGSNEYVAIDNFRICGDVPATDPPVLANIEAAAIDYNEGDAATQITNTITVTDTDSANMEGATVKIIANNVSTEDVLAGTDGGGVTFGVYNSATGTLSMSGTASKAAYETALRTVTYVNTNVTNPNTNPRTVQFQVTDDDANDSNTVTRVINVVNGIQTHAIPYTENFDDGAGTGDRYSVVGGFDVGNNDFFSRLPLADAGTRYATAITGVVGTGFFGGEDIDQNGEADGGKVVLCLDAAGLGNLEVNVLLAAAASGFELTDGLWVEYQFDGGLWQELVAFRPSSFGGPLSEDTDADNVGDGAALTTTLTNYNLPILDTGSVLKVRVRALTSSTSEEIAFDELIVTGSIGGAPPVLANIEGTTINYTEGDAATQVTNTITVTDADSANLEGATIQVFANNVPTEDELSDNGGVPAGITVGVYNSATGTLELTGTATVAEYQTALRSITYVNNNLTNPNQSTRTISFRVNDGALSSNEQTRDIAVLDLVAVQPFPHCESFEDDGLGIRYSANSFDLPPDFFKRESASFGGLSGLNADGTFAFVGKDTDADGNPDHIIEIKVDTTGATNLKLDLKLAALMNQFETTDKILIESSANGGAFVRVSSFHPNGINTSLSEDTNNDGTGDGVTFLGPDFTDHNYPLPDANLTCIRITMNSSSSSEEFAVDNICISGDPILLSFERQNPATSPTSADVLVFRATFNEDVNNVDAADFQVNGATTATVTNVTPVSASEYDVTVSGGDLADFNGTVGLDLAGAQDIVDLDSNPLPAGEPAIDETYELVNTSLMTWQIDNFPGDYPDPAKEATIWGNGADPDGDCVKNIWEFLHGTNPNAFDLLPPVDLGTTGTTFATVSFKKRVDLLSASLDVQVSSNRTSGFVSVVGAPATAPTNPVDPEFVIATYTDDLPVAVGAPRFVKLIMSEGGTDYESETFGTSCLTVTPHTVATPGTLTFMGLQFVKPKVANGTVTAINGTLTDSEANWPVDAFLALDHYVRITSGPHAGAMSDIVSNTAMELTLLDDLSLLAPSIVGESYEIRPHTTIGCVFGENNEGGLFAGINSTLADNIVLVPPLAAEKTIFYDSASLQWLDNLFAPATNEIIHPEQGFVIRRKLADPLNIYQQGAILVGKKTVRIETGFNLLGTIKTNATLTLDELLLTPATGVVPGLSPVDGDNLLIINPDGTTSLYFYLDFGGPLGWFDSSYAPAGTVPVAPGSAFYYHRRPPNPAFNWTIPAE